MKKIKKSLKLIIALSCVALVAIATVVTVLIVNHNRRKGDPTGSEVLLTAEQKLLLAEINKTANSAVSSSMLETLEISDDELDTLRHYTYFDANTCWTNYNPGYDVMVYFKEGESKELKSLFDRMSDKGIIGSVESFEVLQAHKNHFLVLVTYLSARQEVIVCSAENLDITVHKRYDVVSSESDCTHNGDKFRIISSDNYFAVLLKTEETYNYEFYKFLSDYSNYVPFKFEVDNGMLNADVSISSNIFKFDNINAVQYSHVSGFSRVVNNNLIVEQDLVNAKLICTKTVYDTKIAGSELIGGKYYKYAYDLVANGKTTRIDLGEFNKVAGLLYSSEKYFGLYLQKVNESGQAVQGGIAIYFDYNLNTVAKYEASSLNSKIYYYEEGKILTGDGILKASNSVDFKKFSSFDSLGLTFYDMLSNGKFVLKNIHDSLLIYNLNLVQVCKMSFDSMSRAITDNLYVFNGGGDYYLYNVGANTATKTNYVGDFDQFLENTSFYLVANEENYSLYKGSTLIADDITSVGNSIENNIEIQKSNGEIINFYLTKNDNDLQTLLIAFGFDPVYSAVSGAVFSNLYHTGHNGTIVNAEYVEPVWYNYSDVVLRDKEVLTNTDGETYKILAMHCVQNGYYSKTAFRDYFEIAYTGQNSAGKTTYHPLRLYYQVTINNGQPKVEITGLGHYFLYAGNASEVSSLDNKYRLDNYYISEGSRISSALMGTDQLDSSSYDFKTGSGVSTNYYYAYTSNLDAFYGYGFKVSHSDCRAEVYGDSIRVKLIIDFKLREHYPVDFASCRFGQTSITDSDVIWNSMYTSVPSILPSQYYNHLYYQTIFVGYKAPSTGVSTLNSGINYYSDVINQSNTASGGTNITPVTSYFANTQLNTAFTEANQADYFRQLPIQASEAVPSLFTATVSNKTLCASSSDGAIHFIGNIALDIVGGRLIGFTDFNTISYSSINNATLYDLNTRTYKDTALYYRVSDVSGVHGLKYNAELKSYTLQVENKSAIYHSSSGLNKYRYVYAIYEPMTYYMSLDYNISATDDDTNAGLANEIDYLRNYAGLTIGLESIGDYAQYNDLWAFNVDESEFEEYTGTDKYATRNFTDDTTRRPASAGGTTNRTAAVKSGYSQDGLGYYYYYYFTIGSYTYYFNKAHKESDDSYYTYKDEKVGNKLYLTACLGGTNPLTVKLNSSKKSFFHSEITETQYNESAYILGDSTINICIDFSTNADGVVNYIQKNAAGGLTSQTYATIKTQKTNNERRYYVSVEGVNYYFLINHSTYTTSYGSLNDSDDIYLVAYKSTSYLFSSFDTYGKMEETTQTEYQKDENAYDPSTSSKIYICIKKGDDNRAYYLKKTAYTREGSYTGHYNYIGTSTTPTINSDDNALYSAIEKFSFSYIDEIKFTSNPMHTHFTFAGWKVLDGDLTKYNSDTADTADDGIFVPDYSDDTNTHKQQINPVDATFTDARFLAGSGDIYKNLWSDLFTVINSDGSITWKSKSDIQNSPIKLVAQWEPVDCNVEIILWTKDSSTSKHMGLVRDKSVTSESANGYLKLEEISDASIVPEFTKGDESIDKNKDGVLDIHIKFKYSSTKSYIDIFEDINAVYNTSFINSTGMSYKIMGWAYLKKDINQYKPINTASVSIAEYIGDSTKLAVNAFYSESAYNMDFFFNPMGGALVSNDSKNYTGAYNSVYNTQSSFARYNVNINNTIIDSFSKYYLNDIHANSSDMSGIQTGFTGLTLVEGRSQYQVALHNATFFVGDNISIAIREASYNYYVKKLIFREVTLYNDEGKFEKYTITFEYDLWDTSYSNNYGWTITAVSERNGSELDVDFLPSGLAIGLHNRGLDSKNRFSIDVTEPATEPKIKTVTVTIQNLANPGVVDYTTNKLTGEQGFKMECVLESYSIKNETLNVTPKDPDPAPSDDTTTTLNFNDSILTSAQPLTNIEGKSLVYGQPAFVWLGTTRYKFTDEWKSNSDYASGYYRIQINPQSFAEPVEYTYDEFIGQAIIKDSDIVIYYDNTSGLVHYPVQSTMKIKEFKSEDEDRFVVFDTKYKSEPDCYFYIIMGKDSRYVISRNKPYDELKGSEGILKDSSNYDADQEYQECYVWVKKWNDTSSTAVYYRKADETAYNDPANFYENGKKEFVIHILETGAYRFKTNNGESSLYANYNNTRVIAFDPEQDNIVFSESPNTSLKVDSLYELKYYLSSLVINGKTVEFDKPTRSVDFHTDGTSSYYGWNYFNLNTKEFVPDPDNPTEKPALLWAEDFTGAGTKFRYCGEEYTIQDSVKIMFNDDSSFNWDSMLGSRVYYLYLTRHENGFTRYFLIYDIPSGVVKKGGGDFVEIQFITSRLLNEVEINVTEEDLYKEGYYIVPAIAGGASSFCQVIAHSFGLNYIKGTGESYTSSYSFDDRYHLNARTSYETMRKDENIASMNNRTLYESVGYDSTTGNPNALVQDRIKLLSNLDAPTNLAPVLRTLKWSSRTLYYPCQTNRFEFYATSGYIIKSFTILFDFGLGTANLKEMISFTLVDSSFDYMTYSNITGQYSYINSENTAPLLRYKIDNIAGYAGSHNSKESIGVNATPGINYSGLMYSVYKNQRWLCSTKEEYSLDEIFVLVSGLYGNVQINMTTTSYSEFVIENSGDGDHNPLMRGDDSELNALISNSVSGDYIELDPKPDVTTGKVEESALLQYTYLDLFTQVKSGTSWIYDENSMGVDPNADLAEFSPNEGYATGKMVGGTPLGTSSNSKNFIGDKYVLRYYLTDSPGGIKRGTIRIIFCGTVSRIVGGLHFMATHDDYSVYFTNARYYNQAFYEIENSTLTKHDAFVNLVDYSGRSNSDKLIVSSIETKNDGSATIKSQISYKSVSNDAAGAVYRLDCYIEIDGYKYYIINNCDESSYRRTAGGDDLIKINGSPNYNLTYLAAGYYKVQKADADNYEIAPSYYKLTSTYGPSYYEKSYYEKGITSFYIYVENSTSFTAKYNYIDPNSNKSPLNYTNKLIYLSTGKLTDEYPATGSSSSPSFNGYFGINRGEYINESVEKSYKNLLALGAVKNTITVETSAYLFDKTVSSGTYSGTESYRNSSIKYNFTNNNKLVFGGNQVYQLDNTEKENSWFNDTILTNLQFNSYKDEFDGEGKVIDPQTWVNRDPTLTNLSQIRSYEMDGMDFSWTYYTIAGYKLKYIMVYLVDIENYYIIDVASLLPSNADGSSISNSFKLSSYTDNAYANYIQLYNPTSTDDPEHTKSFNYNFKLEFYNDCNPTMSNSGATVTGGTSYIETSCYKFYPQVFVDDFQWSSPPFDIYNEEIDKLKSLNIMANNMKVAFISEPYEYNIQYMNYNGKSNLTEQINSNHISTTPSIVKGNTSSGVTTQSIKYDSMVQLNCTLSMTGYTFIGWGSEKYYNGSSFSSRYVNPQFSGPGGSSGFRVTPALWKTDSVWYDPTPFFVQSRNLDGTKVLSGLDSAINFYNYYANRESGIDNDPCRAFYVNDGYFVTDTGYKEGFDAQNYNFYGNYAELFSQNVRNGYWSSKTGITFENIKLYAIFKANVYTIQFDVNNRNKDTFYLSYNNSDWLTTKFYDNNFAVQTTDGTETKTYYAYITFDTNSWYYSERCDQELVYAYKGAPYSNTLMLTSELGKAVSKLSVDMFGYSWMGWYYFSYAAVNENNKGNIDNNYRVLSSYYNSNSTSYDLPLFDDGFYTVLDYWGSLSEVGMSKAFVYKGQHKANKKIELTRKISGMPGAGEFKQTDPTTITFKHGDDYYTISIDTSSSTKGKEYAVYPYNGSKKIKGMYVKVDDESSSNVPILISLYISNISAVDGYVYFYDYSSSGVGNQVQNYGTTGSWCGLDGFTFTQVEDSLNTLHYSGSAGNYTILYSGNKSSNLLFSYFDTSIGSGAYKISGTSGNYYLEIDRSTANNLRYITLYANWVQNGYKVIFDPLDTSGHADKIGSSASTNVGVQFYDVNEIFYFNEQNLANRLMMYNAQPYRAGYDFVGWSFSYVKPDGVFKYLADIINQPSPILYLCKELFAYYEPLVGASYKTTDASGNEVTIVATSIYESSILIRNNSRLSNAVVNDTDWLLNLTGNGETFGDKESSTNRYIYVFPVWRAQTFSFGISLNISSESLSNLYEKDSNFALGLYNGSVLQAESDGTNTNLNKYKPTTATTIGYTGVPSNYYTYDRNASWNSAGKTYYANYFNDIIANVYFEIEFDQPLYSAVMTFNGIQYKLCDLCVTSAGYYFLGLMYDSTYTYSGDPLLNYFLQNTLKSVLDLDTTTNTTSIKHDDAGGYIEYINGNNIEIFDYTTYTKVYRSRFDDDSVQSSCVQVSGDDLDNENIDGISTNFGKIKIKDDSNDYHIKSEKIGTEYYLYILKNNKKYYVVFYENAGGTIKDTISFDRTFLYYNDKDVNGSIKNSYIIRYDSNTNPYYVVDSYANRVNLSESSHKLEVVLYDTARNTYDFTGYASRSELVSGTRSYTSREFTLYAHWGTRKVTSTVLNGNNNEGSTSGQSDNSNLGLAGWYNMSTVYTSKTTNNQMDTVDSNLVTNKYDFNSTIDYTFLPFYNGRYLSEMNIEFDSFIETSNGRSSTFTLKHNVLTLRFLFTGSTDSNYHTLAIAEVLWNGANYTSALSNTSFTNANGSGRSNYLGGIPELSMIDFNSLDSASPLHIYNYNSGLGLGPSAPYDRKNINPVTLKLSNVLTSVKFTCKFSVQTFQVEVYNVVVANDSTVLQDAGSDLFDLASFSSLAFMENASNKNVANRGLYGAPYISNINYNKEIASTISSNTALQAKSYNIPYGYTMGSTAISDSGYDGFVYIFGGTDGHIYKNGVTGGFVSGSASPYSSLQQIHNNMISGGKYKSYAEEQSLADWENKIWFTYHTTNSCVQLKNYQRGNGKAITENITLYGIFVSEATGAQVKFYYWDTDGYVEYINNANDYNSAFTGAKISQSGSVYKISELPSQSIAPWYGTDAERNKKFIGYVYFNGTILDKILENSIFEEYGSEMFDLKTTYTSTSGDLKSHVYKKMPDKYSLYSTPSINILDLFAHRITVVGNNHYYAKQVTEGAKTFDYLDAVRVQITLDNVPNIGTVIFEKDLKMLNVNSELESGITYAIPLYEDIDFDLINHCYSRAKQTLSISSMVNMVRSNVFEVTHKYTVVFDPADARIGVSSTNPATNVKLSDLNLYDPGGDAEIVENPAGGYYFKFLEQTRAFGTAFFDDVTDGSDTDEYKFGLRHFKQTSGFSYIFLYYVDHSGNAFYKSENYYYLTSSNVTGLNIGDNIDYEPMSPLDFKLNSTYQDHYDKAVAEVDASTYDDSNKTKDEAEKFNRKLVIYILLQLIQANTNVNSTGNLDPAIYIYNDDYDYVYSHQHNNPGTNTGSSNTSIGIKNVINAINNKIKHKIDQAPRVTNYKSLYRLAYSLAYYHVKTTRVNQGNTVGLKAIYENGASLSYDNINTVMGENFLSSGSNLRPGDFLKDNESSGIRTLVKDPVDTSKLDNPNNAYSYTTESRSSEIKTVVTEKVIASGTYDPISGSYKLSVELFGKSYLLYSNMNLFDLNTWASSDTRRVYRLTVATGDVYQSSGLYGQAQGTVNTEASSQLFVWLQSGYIYYNVYKMVPPSDNTQIALYLYSQKNPDGSYQNVTLLMPRMSVESSNGSIEFKDVSNNKVSVGSEGVKMDFVTTRFSLDRLYQTYEKYERFKFIYVSGLYQMDPTTSLESDSYFYGVTIPQSCTDPAGGSGAKRMGRSVNLISQDANVTYTNSIYYVTTASIVSHIGVNCYIYEEDYKTIVQTAKTEAETEAKNHADGLYYDNADDYANAIWAATGITSWLDYYVAPNEEDYKKTILVEMTRPGTGEVYLEEQEVTDTTAFNQAKANAESTARTAYTNVMNNTKSAARNAWNGLYTNAYNAKYNEVFPMKLEELLTGYAGDVYFMDAESHYNATSKVGYVIFDKVSVAEEDRQKFYYFKLNEYYFRVKNAEATLSANPTESELDSRYYILSEYLPGYDREGSNLHYWLRISGSSGGSGPNTNPGVDVTQQQKYIYTRFESFFTNEWNS